MPFLCTFQLNNGAIKKEDEVVFLEFIESSFGSFHEEKVRIADVFFNGKKAFISSNSPCFPSTKGQLKKGQLLDAKTAIGFFSANGEDIPYDRPYAVIELSE